MFPNAIKSDLLKSIVFSQVLTRKNDYLLYIYIMSCRRGAVNTIHPRSPFFAFCTSKISTVTNIK